MVHLLDGEYYRQREQQERDAYHQTDEPLAKRLHLELAMKYSLLALQAELQCKLDKLNANEGRPSNDR